MTFHLHTHSGDTIRRLEQAFMAAEQNKLCPECGHPYVVLGCPNAWHKAKPHPVEAAAERFKAQDLAQEFIRETLCVHHEVCGNLAPRSSPDQLCKECDDEATLCLESDRRQGA